MSLANEVDKLLEEVYSPQELVDLGHQPKQSPVTPSMPSTANETTSVGANGGAERSPDGNAGEGVQLRKGEAQESPLVAVGEQPSSSLQQNGVKSKNHFDDSSDDESSPSTAVMPASGGGVVASNGMGPASFNFDDDVDAVGVATGAHTKVFASLPPLPNNLTGRCVCATVAGCAKATAASRSATKHSAWDDDSDEDHGQDHLASTRCPYLLCTKCDNRVMAIDSCRWVKQDGTPCDAEGASTSRVEHEGGEDHYMFLRYHYPNQAILQQRLVTEPGATALCCQCTGYTARGPLQVPRHGSVRWVCQGHPPLGA